MTQLTSQEKQTLATYERYSAEIYNEHNAEVIDDLIAEDFQHHAPFPTPSGRDGFRQFIGGFWQAFPDATSIDKEVVVDGDRIAVLYVMRATHEGDFMDIPATGKRVEVKGISIYRVENGQIAEEWAQPDLMSMMQQLGAVPAGGPQ